MKKKKFLFLTVLLVAMFLTGCATTTEAEALKKSNDVANEVAANIGEYKLPDGYDMSYPDSKDTSRFYLASTTEENYTLTAEYQISNKEAVLVDFTVEDNSNSFYLGMGVIIFILGIILGAAIVKSND